MDGLGSSDMRNSYININNFFFIYRLCLYHTCPTTTDARIARRLPHSWGLSGNHKIGNTYGCTEPYCSVSGLCQTILVDNSTSIRVSIYGVNIRTNNFVESFHSMLKFTIVIHPQVWSFYGN